MDEINESPNVVFPFTVVNADEFQQADVKKIFTPNQYALPDYWFKTNDDLLTFSKKLKISENFLDYFYKMLKSVIEKKYDSFIIMTLRTNFNIVFVKVDSSEYLKTIENLIEMKINLERYEQCQLLTDLKELILSNHKPMIGKNSYYETYEFWNAIYPIKL